MKKKNLIILLLIPFIIALLGIVTINVSFNFIETDIVAIKWNYKDVEGFKIREEPYKLTASGEKHANATLAEGNELTWKVENKDDNVLEPLAEIIYENGNYYLKPLKEGEVLVTCSNEKGTVFKTMSVVLYKTGAILVNQKVSSSQNNIDPKTYYGQYDIKNNNKQAAEIQYSIDVVPYEFASSLTIKEKTDNIDVNLDSKTVKVNNPGKSFFTLSLNDESIKDVTISFDVVKDGVNVYSYDDLLYCTNKSENGEIMVLRKSFESLNNVAISDSSNTEIFGNYNASSKTYNFKNEVYQFTTNFNHEYISQWNEFAKTKDGYSTISDQIYAGLKVSKDVYGNGYTINFHNLTYPYDISKVTGTDGKVYDVPMLSQDNLFRGPLPFYTLGDPNGMPLITAFGQDNVGMYIDGDNITINDLNIKNCDLPNSLAYMDSVGNVVDINGDNVTIKNSRLSNGKNIIRSFSSNNLLIDNCILSNSRNFLITTGANEYLKLDDAKQYSFTNLDGSKTTDTLSNYLSKESEGNNIVTTFIDGSFTDKEKMKKSMASVDNAINDPSKVDGQYKGSMNINDTMFYRSGIASIALETYFNGAYLYSNIPSIIGEIFAQINYDDRPLVPLEPSNVSGISYPVKVNVSGDSRFYDYKDIAKMDITGLISENISVVANSVTGQDIRKITIDDIFPIKSMLSSKARSKNCVYTKVNEDNKTSNHFNVAIAYYGGGLNLSKVTYDGFDYPNTYLSDNMDIDFLDNYLNLASVDPSQTMAYMKNLMLKSVISVIGCQPFKFVCTYNNNELFEETFEKSPSVDLLKDNAKGA